MTRRLCVLLALFARCAFSQFSPATFSTVSVRASINISVEIDELFVGEDVIHPLLDSEVVFKLSDVVSNVCFRRAFRRGNTCVVRRSSVASARSATRQTLTCCAISLCKCLSKTIWQLLATAICVQTSRLPSRRPAQRRCGLVRSRAAAMRGRAALSLG